MYNEKKGTRTSRGTLERHLYSGVSVVENALVQQSEQAVQDRRICLEHLEGP